MRRFLVWCPEIDGTASTPDDRQQPGASAREIRTHTNSDAADRYAEQTYDVRPFDELTLLVRSIENGRTWVVTVEAKKIVEFYVTIDREIGGDAQPGTESPC